MWESLRGSCGFAGAILLSGHWVFVPGPFGASAMTNLKPCATEFVPQTTSACLALTERHGQLQILKC